MKHVVVTLNDGRAGKGFGETDSTAVRSAVRRLGVKCDQAFAWPGGVAEIIHAARIVGRVAWKAR